MKKRLTVVLSAVLLVLFVAAAFTIGREASG